MNKWGGAIRNIPRFFLNPRPSLFDLCVVFGIIGMGFIPTILHGLYFCFFSVFITVIGFNYKTRRNFRSPGLTLLALLGLLGVFKHSFIISQKSITFEYLNFYLMFEGFGYIFFGCLMLYMLVTKGRNLRLIYFTIPLCLWQFIDRSIYGGRISVIVAMMLGFIIYLIIKRRYQLATLFSLVGLNLAMWNIDWVILKWGCRIPIWYDLVFSKSTFPPIGILQHPIIGHGFNKLILLDNMFVVSSYSGLLFAHNDYLNIMNILGMLAVIPITMLLWQIIRITKNSWYIAPVLGIAILCFGQMTMFAGDRALAIVSFLALAVIENERAI